MTEIERLTKVREMLGEARRYVAMDVFPDVARGAIDCLDDSDSACADSLRVILANATSMRLVDPDATRGAIDYTRGWLAWIIGRLERDDPQYWVCDQCGHWITGWACLWCESPAADLDVDGGRDE